MATMTCRQPPGDAGGNGTEFEEHSFSHKAAEKRRTGGGHRTTAMITAFPAASAQVPPGGLARAGRSASMLRASRKLPAASPPT
jgi:hypothetical protein